VIEVESLSEIIKYLNKEKPLNVVPLLDFTKIPDEDEILENKFDFKYVL
jgi:hypothetical protein